MVNFGMDKVSLLAFGWETLEFSVFSCKRQTIVLPNFLQEVFRLAGSTLTLIRDLSLAKCGQVKPSPKETSVTLTF